MTILLTTPEAHRLIHAEGTRVRDMRAVCVFHGRRTYVTLLSTGARLYMENSFRGSVCRTSYWMVGTPDQLAITHVVDHTSQPEGSACQGQRK